MADTKTTRVRLTTEEKLAKLQAQNNSRKGLEEISLELVQKVTDLKLSAKETRVLINTFLTIVVETLKSGKSVMLPGFGRFYPKARLARKVRNPRVNSGPEAFKQVGPSTVYRFKAGSEMKPTFS
jgi:nucleoid DNA-binding protein